MSPDRPLSRLLRSLRSSRFAGPAVILLAAALACVPILLRGPYCGDDYQFHLISWLDAQQSWRQGIPYPHWASSPNYGAGEPRFVFYPPLTWMMGAALGLVLPWSWVAPVLIFLLLSATGIGTLMLARELLPEAPATLAGCAAIFSLYALFTAYERAAFGELAGGFWIPLLLLFALRDCKQRERKRSASLWGRALDGSTVPLALVLAGAWLSDAPLGLMASYLLAAVALAAAVLARSWAPIVRASIAAVLGIGHCALYLVPAAYQQRWVDMRQATGAAGDPGLLIENNWLFARHSSPALQLHDAEAHRISLLAVAMIAVALLSLLALWLRGGLSPAPTEGRERLARRWWVPLASIPVVVLFLQVPLSRPVWELLPRLHFLQFPWRWLLAVEAPMGIFLAAAVWPDQSVWPVKAARRWQRAAAFALCAVFFLGSITWAAGWFFRVCQADDSLTTLLARHRSGAGFWGADEYAPPDADNSTVATGLPDACLVTTYNAELGVAVTPDSNPDWRPQQGSCDQTSTAALRQTEHLRIVTVAPHPGYLVLRLRTYPAWRISLNGRSTNDLPSRIDGLMVVPVPAGPIDLRVDWTATPDVIAGRWLSVLSLMLLVAVGVQERKLSRLS